MSMLQKIENEVLMGARQDFNEWISSIGRSGGDSLKQSYHGASSQQGLSSVSY